MKVPAAGVAEPEVERLALVAGKARHAWPTKAGT